MGLLLIAEKYLFQQSTRHVSLEHAAVLQEHTVLIWEHVQSHAGLKRSDRLTPHQLGLAVDELWFPCRAVALAGVVENLDEGALLSSWTSAPLVKRIFKHQVKLWTVLEENTREERTWAKTVALKCAQNHLRTAQNSDQRRLGGSLLCWGRYRWPAAADQVSTVTFSRRQKILGTASP